MKRDAYSGQQVDMLSSERIRELRAEDAATPVTFAVCEINLSAPWHRAWTLLTTSADRERMERFTRTMNATERNPYVLYRCVDYATARERILPS